jgi:acetyl esterase/lipase
VFRPKEPPPEKPLPAIVLFHGGGWTIGEAEWAFDRAQRFAELGMVAVAAQYRLSNQSTITPLEAMADARAVIRWMRSKAAELGIDPKRIAAYGWSAGGHLAVSAAIFDGSTSHRTISAAPNALILISPAVHLENDGWVQRLLGSHASVSAISPAAHVRRGLPPTLVLQGSEDTVTPLAGAWLFCERMRAAGNRCDLQVYRGVGHLFTPAGIRDDGWPQPDPAVQAEASRKAEEFLVTLGFIK